MAKSKDETQNDTQLAYFDRDKLIWGSCLKSNEKLLLHALNSFVGADGRCFPKHNLLAEMTSLSRSSVIRVMKSLEESGVVQVEWRYRPDGSQSSNDYFLDWEALKALNHKGVSNCNRGVSKSNTRVLNSDTGGSNIEHQELTNSTTQSTNQLTTQVNIKASGNAGSGKKENFEVGSASNESKTNGGVSPGSNPESYGANENDSHSQNKGLYDRVWNPNTEGFRVDSRGWAFLPPTPKFKLPNYMATRGMQLEVLNIMDSDFTAEWNEAESQLYITTSYGDAGFEDDILGTVTSVGTNWVEYENDDICQPGNNSLRLLRDWGYKEGEFDQDWFNTRLKELWDEAVAFCAEHGKNAKALFKSRPAWCSLSINIDFDDEES